ncbi:MAG: hypothetical protein NTU44_07955, partial [Bacteroidetes bacterium]|nr:hypothetical protein [Bacteroidota bacterium]
MRLRFFSNLIFLLNLAALLLSCHGNRLKTNEKGLVQEILQEEKQEAERIARENQLADTLSKLPPGFRFREDRSSDPAKPPVVIDIAGSLNNVKDFKLSDIASKVIYIRLEKVPDPTFSRAMRFKYYLMDNQIVAANPSGILLYSREGKFERTIVKNEFTGIEVNEDYMSYRGDHTFIGGGTTVWASGKNLYYKYRNTFTGQSYIMEYDCTQQQVNQQTRINTERPDEIRGLGRVAVDLNYGKPVAPSSKGATNGMWSAGTDFFYSTIGTFLLDRNTYAKPLGNAFQVGGNYMMGIFNKRGDTLTTFTQFEKLKSYSKSLMRGTDQG